jgi:hypothetical protein
MISAGINAKVDQRDVVVFGLGGTGLNVSRRALVG